MALVGGVVVVLIAFAFYGPLTGAANNLYLQFIEHCEVDGDPTLAVRNFPTPGSGMQTFPVDRYTPASRQTWGTDNSQGFQLSHCAIGRSAVPTHWLQTSTYQNAVATATPSTVGSGTMDDGTDWYVFSYSVNNVPVWLMIWQVYTEDGLEVGLASPLSDSSTVPCTTDCDQFTFPNSVTTFPLAASHVSGEWLQAREITKRFGAINKLLISLLPLLLVISFLASAWGSLYAYATASDGGIKDAISWETMTLVALMIAVFLAPVFFEFAEGAALVASSGAYQTTKQFGAIISLLFSLMPLAFTIGVIGIAVQRGYRTVQNMRGG